MAKFKRKPVVVEERPAGFEDMYQKFVMFYSNLTVESRKKWIIGTLSLSALLATLASIPDILSLASVNLNIPNMLFAIVGLPAAIMVFLNLIVVAEFSKIKEADIFKYKSKYPPTRRIRDVTVGTGLALALLILLNGALPDGLGGIVITVIALTAYNLIRRTPEEIQLAKAGLPDPRDLTEESDENKE